MKITEGNISISELLLECGESLNDINVRYHILGDISKDPDKVIWICHAFTANSNPADWWQDGGRRKGFSAQQNAYCMR